LTAGIVLCSINVDVAVESLEGHPDTDIYPNFNVIFDAEAADGDLRGNWTHVTTYGTVTLEAAISNAIIDSYMEQLNHLMGRVFV
jgi:hypothetical protein